MEVRRCSLDSGKDFMACLGKSSMTLLICVVFRIASAPLQDKNHLQRHFIDFYRPILVFSLLIQAAIIATLIDVILRTETLSFILYHVHTTQPHRAEL